MRVVAVFFCPELFFTENAATPSRSHKTISIAEVTVFKSDQILLVSGRRCLQLVSDSNRNSMPLVVTAGSMTHRRRRRNVLPSTETLSDVNLPVCSTISPSCYRSVSICGRRKTPKCLASGHDPAENTGPRTHDGERASEWVEKFAILTRRRFVPANRENDDDYSNTTALQPRCGSASERPTARLAELFIISVGRRNNTETTTISTPFARRANYSP